jgi:hypothetical protein
LQNGAEFERRTLVYSDPRSIGDPAADISDLFAFTSPENPARTVLAVCVFPAAGEDAMFSNVVDYAIAVRRITVGGVGNAASFQPADDEVRFSFRFEVLARDAAGNVHQRGVGTLPSGRTLSLTVNDENGASTPDGDFRVFAGLRFEPFYLAWIASELRKVPNLLQNDNVLCIVVEFDTRRVLDPAKGSLFGAIAETVPVPQPPSRIGHPVARIDWIGTGADERTAQQSRAVRGRRHPRSVESADAVRDLRSAAAAVPAAAEGQLRGLGPARRQGRLDSGRARRQRECLPR